MAAWNLTGPTQQAGAVPWRLTGPDNLEPEKVPTSGVTEIAKGGVPQEADVWERANLLPFAINKKTGERALAVPGALYDAATLPGDVYTGKVDVNSPEAGRRAAGFALAATPTVPGLRGAPLARAPQEALMETPKVPANKVVPTTAEIKAMAQQAYKEAEDAGVQVKPSSYNEMVKKVVGALEKEGIDKTLHPSSRAAAERLISRIVRPKKPDAMSALTGVVPKAPNKNFSLEELDTLRRVAGVAEKGFDPKYADDRRLAGIITDAMDSWLSSLGPHDVSAGDPKAASFAIKKARALWARMRRSEVLDDINERALNAVGANYSAGQLQTAMRQQFKNLLNNKNKIRAFSKEEQAAIRAIVRGDKVENVLRYLGKFAPNSPMSLFLSGGAGYMAGGPIGAAVLGFGGTAAKFASTKMGQSKVDAANALVRRGY